MKQREQDLVKAYGASWPKLVNREQGPNDVALTFSIEGFDRFEVRLLTTAAPQITKSLLAKLPLEGHLIHSAWSGCGVRGLESVVLPEVDGHENSTYFPAPGDFCYTVGHDEITTFYGDASPTMPSGKVRESVVGVLEGRLPDFQRACILTRLTGARPFRLEQL